MSFISRVFRRSSSTGPSGTAELNPGTTDAAFTSPPTASNSLNSSGSLGKSMSLDKDVRDELVEQRRQMLKERPVQCRYTKEHHYYKKGIWDTDPNNIYSQDTHPVLRTRSRKLSDLPAAAKVEAHTAMPETVPEVRPVH